MNKIVFILFFSFFFVVFGESIAQKETDERVYIDFKDGIGFKAPDSLFFMNMRFRMQNRLGFNADDEFNIEEVEATVKRLRLRFDGFILNPKLTYYLQLSFAQGDLGMDGNQKPNIIRDAIIHYHFSNRFYIGFGQGKLPGNRQRITSSGSQQFAERSTVNSIFNIDRDFGVFMHYTQPIGKTLLNLKAAVSTGEGRNLVITDDQLAYTARIEFLPFGAFKSKGDFFEGDLLRESSPKLSIASAFSKNFNAIRTQGQRGCFIKTPRDINTLFADMIFKYNGWAFQSEYAFRDIALPVVEDVDDKQRVMFVGQGINTQLSYCFRNNYEIAARHSYVVPSDKIKDFEPTKEVYMLGINKYIVQHKAKVQLNASRINQSSNSLLLNTKSYWNFMFQVEIGI
ncbi:MAG: porin [Bacteroidales bacterium]|nr:porin [Bacteroidales bacterium]